jgi:hypothetical protein
MPTAPATVTLPLADYRRLLEAWARAERGVEPTVAAFAQEIDGEWVVTVDDGEDVTLRPVFPEWPALTGTEPPARLEVHPTIGDLCAECGEELGEGAYLEDTRTATFRGTIGEKRLAGCTRCVAHVERERSAA